MDLHTSPECKSEDNKQGTKQNSTWLNHNFSKSDDPSNAESDTFDDAKLAQFFNLYDKDGSGTLSYEELKAALQLESGGEFSNEEFRQLMVQSDGDSNLTIDLAELRQLIIKFRRMQREKSSFTRSNTIRTKLNDAEGSCRHMFCNGVILKPTSTQYFVAFANLGHSNQPSATLRVLRLRP